MRVLVATEQHFVSHRGAVYTYAVDDYGFWRRYLDAFSSVQVLARVREVTSLEDKAVRADGEAVSFFMLPDYVGPIEGIRRLPALVRGIWRAAREDAAFILRVPGAIGTFLYWRLRLRKHPYAVEVVGDPHDSLNPQALRTFWAPFFRALFVRALRSQCRNAAAAAYVTRGFLQSRYPSRGFSTHYSSVELPAELFEVGAVRSRCQGPGSSGGSPESGREARLLFVGSLSQRYKGLHVLLRALRLCANKGQRLRLDVLGDGAYRAEYEQLAAELGVGDSVTFHGYVSRKQGVLQQLQESDLFVMPSLVEGLPRAMLEAMACGVPCVGSDIGGIPELLSPDDMVPPGDSEALAAKLAEVLNSPRRLREMSERNYRAAMDYKADMLRARRKEFYEYVRGVTDKSISASGS